MYNSSCCHQQGPTMFGRCCIADTQLTPVLQLKRGLSQLQGGILYEPCIEPFTVFAAGLNQTQLKHTTLKVPYISPNPHTPELPLKMPDLPVQVPAAHSVCSRARVRRICTSEAPRGMKQLASSVCLTSSCALCDLGAINREYKHRLESSWHRERSLRLNMALPAP